MGENIGQDYVNDLDPLPQFPLRNRMEVESFSSHLSNSKSMQMRLESVLIQLMNSVRYHHKFMVVMRHLMTYQVAMKYNWSGVKNKKSFRNLALASSLIDMFVRAGVHSDHHEARQQIVEWLRGAGCRYKLTLRYHPEEDVPSRDSGASEDEQ